MEKVVLEATRRSVIGKKVGALRREGKLPAVLYGHHFDPTPILLDLHDASLTLHNVTASSLVTIKLEGKEHAALVREKQRNYVKGTLLHVDFQVVSLTEKIRANVGVEISGVAPAVKMYNGVVITGMDSVEVECFPQDLPERITVDISGLANVGDGVYVRDLKVSDKVEMLTDGDEMIVLVTGAAPEEEEALESTGTEPEVIEKGKKEEEEED